MIPVGCLLNLLGEFIQKGLKVLLFFPEVSTKKNLTKAP